MLVVETVARIRRAHFVHGKSIKAIARELRLSRNTVRRVLRSGATALSYERDIQPRPKLEGWTERLEQLVAGNEKLARHDRLNLIRIFESLQGEGFSGGYDAGRRCAQARARRGGTGSGEAFVPLCFAPGEAYQFDWSHETVVLGGITMHVKVAHVRLCHSRMPFARAYPRETQEMVFDAHEQVFGFFRGACQRGIYDNMRTAVDAVFAGPQRAFNSRFLQMCSHYLVEPTACTPASGWEKGQVENQVNTLRERLFKPRPRFATRADLNAWLLEQCVAHARRLPHPECQGRTVWDMFEAERPHLVRNTGPFDGFHARAASVSKTCLVQFDRNKYSVMSQAVGRPVDIHAYAERIVIRQDGQIVAEHARSFGRDQALYDPWHYVPVLARKPGALRNGAPFRGWSLPGALGRVRQKLRGSEDGDRQMVKILAAVLTEGLEPVEAACAEALSAGLCGSDVLLNVLSRQRPPASPVAIAVPAALALRQEPLADCSRYDSLRSLRHGAS